MLIGDIAKDSSENSENDKANASTYLRTLERCNEATKTVLTTHARALHDTNKHQTIIFDEDPLDNILVDKELNLNDLRIITSNFSSDENLKRFEEHLKKIPKGVIYTNPNFEINQDELANSVLTTLPESNIIDFFSASSYQKNKRKPDIINYMVKRELPKDKKIIILSATINPYLYKQLYGDRVKVIEIPLAKTKGKITQNVSKGYSRSYLSSLDEHGKKDLKQMSSDKKIITFKGYKEFFDSACEDIHFGNCTGYNSYSGEDLTVIGTPHFNEEKCLFIAHGIGIDISNLNPTLKMRKITWNGFKFMFQTYEDERLRNIQLGMEEAQLVQAVGRARSLRTNASVEVYSNLPLRIATEFKS